MNRRLALALATLAGWLLITVVGGHLHTGRAPLTQAVTQGLGWPFLLAVLWVLAIAAWQRWHDLGLGRRPAARSLRLAWLPMVYIVAGLLVATAAGLPPATVLLWIVLNTFLVGLSEELMFRGVLLQAARRSFGIWAAVGLTTLAFGAVHVLNVFITGELRPALLQATAAALSGLLFIALRLRTGSLWPGMVVHALWDFATFVLATAGRPDSHAGAADAPTGLAHLLPVLLVLPNALYGLWLMRRIGRTHARPDEP